MHSTQTTARDDIDAWLSTFDAVVKERGRAFGKQLLDRVGELARALSLALPADLSTPYVNTIPVEVQPPYPGDREIERRIKNVIRWNAMAMVVQANKHHPGIGGHISTFE